MLRPLTVIATAFAASALLASHLRAAFTFDLNFALDEADLLD